MKKIFFFLFAILAITVNLFAQKNISLCGKITDQKDGEALFGVSLYFPDLKIGGITDSEGYYQVNNLPKTKLLIEITYRGYQHIVQQIDLANTSVQNFEMKDAITELGQVVITGLSKAAQRNRTPAPISVITPIQLKQSAANNIIEALATQPGISQITTGSGISKPVIRGLGYNRVVVVNDGIRQEGQQWGDEHGIEIDQYSINRVEVLKGPASLMFGSDAMAGVINMLPSPTLPEGTIRGNVLTNYQTNNGLLGGSIDLGGNQKGIVWGLRYSQKAARAYQTRMTDMFSIQGSGKKI